MSETAKKRGRPRAFEPEVVLPRAFDTFLLHGYAGTSIDALATAMGLNKPSLYAAFGDKRRLFQRVMEDRVATLGHRFVGAMARGNTLEELLRELYLEAVALYEEQPGCLVVSPAVTESTVDPELAEYTRKFFELTDRGIASALARFVPDKAKAATLGRLSNGIIHDIALRSRVGESRTKLRAFAKESAQLLAGC